MKTKEFIKRVAELGYGVEIGYFNVCVKRLRPDLMLIAKVNKKYQYTAEMSSIYEEEDENAKELFLLCAEYARTPIEDREEEKKFYLKISGSFYTGDYVYLNFDKSTNNYWLHNNHQSNMYKTQFTQKEIDEIKEKFNTNLEEFEQIPVEED